MVRRFSTRPDRWPVSAQAHHLPTMLHLLNGWYIPCVVQGICLLRVQAQPRWLISYCLEQLVSGLFRLVLPHLNFIWTSTGVTSNLALRYLLNQQRQPTFSRDCTRRHFTLSIAIQSISELKDVLVSLGNLDGIEPIVLDPYNEAEVEKTIRRAKVVLNFMERNWEFSFGVIKWAIPAVYQTSQLTKHL